MTVAGALFADIDSLSVWPWERWLGFPLFDPDAAAQVYASHRWYAHQAFSHSLLGMFLITLSFWVASSGLHSRLFHRAPRFGSSFAYLAPYWAGWGIGYVLHLAEDLFTPAGPWGGIALAFPSDQYIGGWGWVWWWNNYDIQLILLAAFAVHALMIFWSPVGKKGVRLFPVFVMLLASTWIGLQIHRRHYDFNRLNFTANEQFSHRFAQDALGENLYQAFYALDRKVSGW
jgi:hypothetical protein